eukprot:2100603-Pyramimonas_sp.AAC.1
MSFAATSTDVSSSTPSVALEGRSLCCNECRVEGVGLRKLGVGLPRVIVGAPGPRSSPPNKD